MIQVEGPGLERFLNRALAAGARLWNVRRKSRSCMTLEISAKDFLCRMPKARREARCRIRILERHGAPFVIARFRWRKLLVAGCLLFACGIFAASTRLWRVEVQGCYRVPEAVVYRALEQAGIEVGMSSAKIVNADVAKAVSAFDQRIAWTGVRTVGVTLHVEVVEAEPIPQLPDESVPTDVIAQKDGLIEKVTAYSGKANVAPGDAVRAGDVLIRGDITREDAEKPLLVHAEGEVLAKVWYEASIVLPPTAQQLMPSGKTEPYRALYVARIPVFVSQAPYVHYTVERSSEAKAPGMVLPLQQVRGVYRELTLQDVEQPLAERKAEALFQAELQALEQVPKGAVVLEKRAEAQVLEDGSIKGQVQVCALEQIGVPKEIGETPIQDG